MVLPELGVLIHRLMLIILDLKLFLQDQLKLTLVLLHWKGILELVETN